MKNAKKNLEWKYKFLSENGVLFQDEVKMIDD
jgi:hypothetical protein